MSKEYNVVTNYTIIQEVKKYKHYIVSLGFASTVEKGHDRVLSETDSFAYFYNKRYNTTIYGQGIIGNINFYTDHYIHEHKLAIYVNKEEFVFDFDFKTARERGIEWYLGSLLKEVENELETKEIEKLDIQQQADATKITLNPGAVTYEDLKAYLASKKG